MRDLLSRRDLLRTASLAALGSFLPSALWAGGAPRTVRSDRALVLVEFEGGNDGLNTIIPHNGANRTLYGQRRSTLALSESTNAGTGGFNYQNNYFNLGTTFRGGATGLNNQTQAGDLGIHSALVKLKDAWQAKDLAVVLGVGYANPNRSHFRGIDIWNTGATDDQQPIPSGWLGRMFTQEGLDAASKTNALLFRRANYSPLVNSASKAVAMDSPEAFISSSAYLLGDSANDIPALVTAPPADTDNDALDRILTARWQVVEARTSLLAAMARTEPGGDLHHLLAPFDAVDPPLSLVTQARHVFRCIAGGLNCPVYKISLSGFDTHTAQKGKHADLLGEFGRAMSLLRTALIAAGKWDATLIMTYSEFGRRIEENGSAGTDHGTAAPHFFLGGGINGGIYGTQPTLAVPHPWDDMVATMDFRNLYAVCGDWLSVTTANDGLGLDPYNAGLSFSALDGLLPA